MFLDASLVGHDYLITGRGELSPNTEWWFQATGASAHFQKDVAAEDLHHTLRVGIVARPARLREVVDRVAGQFGQRVFIQSFEAVQRPDPQQSMHVLELFAPGVDKWRGLMWIAEQHNIAPEQIATIGDQVNDVSMITQAGCGIAMANAIAPVKQAASRVTLDCDQHGVAFAVEQLLAGRW